MKKRTRIKLKRFFVKLLIWIGCSALYILISTLLWLWFDMEDGGLIDKVLGGIAVGCAIGLCRKYDVLFAIKTLGEDEVIRILEEKIQDK